MDVSSVKPLLLSEDADNLNFSQRNYLFPKTDRVTGRWRKLHNEELHNLYSSPSIIRIIKSRGTRWAGYVARMGGKRNLYRLLVGKPEGKKPLGRHRDVGG
jgi:hypothetical protein